MPAVPRTAPTGAPSATAAADPLLSSNAPITQRLAPAVLARYSGVTDKAAASSAIRSYTSPVDGATMQVVQAHTPSASAVYTGETAIDRAGYLGTQIANITGDDPAAATRIVRDYNERTGSYPDLTQLGATGSGYAAPLDLSGNGSGLQQASVLGGGLTMWIVLGAIGLVLALVYGKKR